MKENWPCKGSLSSAFYFPLYMGAGLGSHGKLLSMPSTRVPNYTKKRGKTKGGRYTANIRVYMVQWVGRYRRWGSF
jgi:hypothetical protein